MASGTMRSCSILIELVGTQGSSFDMARSTRDLKGQDKTRKLADFKPESKVDHITKVQMVHNGQEKQESRKRNCKRDKFEYPAN